VQEFDEKGRVNPHYIKHWKFFSRTKEFLHRRYAQHHILEGPTLIFDCLVGKFQAPIFKKSFRDEHGNPVFYEVNDSHEWYDKAIRMGVFKWHVGFSCRSLLCERDWCKLHRGNPQRISPCDIYSLIQLFEACVPGKALAAVGKWFDVKLGPFESKGIREKKQILRYAVSKDALYDLLVRYKTLRHQLVKEFMREARALIERSDMVPWHSRLFEKERVFLSSKVMGNLYRIDGPAVKAYLWLLIRQEELARNTKGPRLSVSDLELAKAVGVSKTTAQNYRARLMELKLVQASTSKSSKTNEILIERVKY